MAESTEFPSLATLKHVVIDEQLKQQYESESSSPTFQPTLGYYAPLIANAKFVIGGLTSMLVEAQLLGKQFVGLAHDDPSSWINPLKTLHGYTHFREIGLLKNVHLITDLGALESTFVNLCQDGFTFEPDPFLDYFLTFDDETYWEKLGAVISVVD